MDLSSFLPLAKSAVKPEGATDPLIDGFTQAQRFFFGWATIWRQNLTLGEASFRLRHDRHAPASSRTNAAAASVDAYAQVFERADRDRKGIETSDRVSIW